MSGKQGPPDAPVTPEAPALLAISAPTPPLREASSTEAPSSLAESKERLVSDFCDDPDLSDIVQEFVVLLGERSRAISQAAKDDDVPTLRRLAHQLKGAAGGYGFPLITAHAKSVEDALAGGADPRALRKAVESLCALCDRATVAPAAAVKADRSLTR
jgi:HPt (histidine-containing phosphotransfer) domain-containing protein